MSVGPNSFRLIWAIFACFQSHIEQNTLYLSRNGRDYIFLITVYNNPTVATHSLSFFHYVHVVYFYFHYILTAVKLLSKPFILHELLYKHTNLAIPVFITLHHGFFEMLIRSWLLAFADVENGMKKRIKSIINTWNIIRTHFTSRSYIEASLTMHQFHLKLVTIWNKRVLL